MSEIYRHALAAVQDRLAEGHPNTAAEFEQKTTTEALRNPSSENVLIAHIDWPTYADAESDVGIKANLPGERYEGMGHLDIRFSFAEPIGEEPTKLRTDLHITYGQGTGGIEPFGATLQECFEDVWGETQPIIAPIAPDAAAVILAKFGILPQE